MSKIIVRELTPEEVQAKMISLHHELGNFQLYLARQTMPPKWEGPEYEAVNRVLELLERETKRMGIAVHDRKIDNLVTESLRQAGFKPDEPPAGDSK